MTETQLTSGDDDIIRVENIPFDENIPLGQLKGIAKKWFKEKYRGTKRANQGTGRIIEVKGSGIGHTISHARNIDVIYSLEALPEMIERMKFLHAEPPRDSEDGKPLDNKFLGVEIYQARVLVRGTLYVAEFVVKIWEIVGGEVGKVGDVRFYYYNHKFTKGSAERTA